MSAATCTIDQPAGRLTIAVDPGQTIGPAPWGTAVPGTAGESGKGRLVAPGEVAVVNARARAWTILGSCVAVTVWDPLLGRAGICHFVNAERRRPPERGPSGLAATEPLNGWYADDAFTLLLQAMELSAPDLQRCGVKVFGAGQQFGDSSGPRRIDPARSNLQAAQRLMLTHAVHPTVWHVGGWGTRVLVLDGTSGTVWLQHTSNELPPAVPVGA